MSSWAAKVNEKHYQCRLILAQSKGLDSEGVDFQARQQALEQAACLLLGTAYRLFLTEVASSCQLKEFVSVAQELSRALEGEGVSHPIVDTLLVLEAERGSWLSQLNIALERCSNGDRLNPLPSTGLAILVSDAQQSFDVEGCLVAFVDFVAQQRSYLAEW